MFSLIMQINDENVKRAHGVGEYIEKGCQHLQGHKKERQTLIIHGSSRYDVISKIGADANVWYILRLLTRNVNMCRISQVSEKNGCYMHIF